MMCIKSATCSFAYFSQNRAKRAPPSAESWGNNSCAIGHKADHVPSALRRDERMIIPLDIPGALDDVEIALISPRHVR